MVPSVHFTLLIVKRTNDQQALIIVSRQALEHATVLIDHPINMAKSTSQIVQLLTDCFTDFSDQLFSVSL